MTNLNNTQIIETLQSLIKQLSDKPENYSDAKNDTTGDGLMNQYVMVRTYSAGVFAGTLVDRKGKEVTLINARRIYEWYGAATLSQLAQEGTSMPNKCKFPPEVDKVFLLEAIELIPISDKAKQSIKSVPVWRL